MKKNIFLAQMTGGSFPLILNVFIGLDLVVPPLKVSKYIVISRVFLVSFYKLCIAFSLPETEIQKYSNTLFSVTAIRVRPTISPLTNISSPPKRETGVTVKVNQFQRLSFCVKYRFSKIRNLTKISYLLLYLNVK